MTPREQARAEVDRRAQAAKPETPTERPKHKALTEDSFCPLCGFPKGKGHGVLADCEGR